LRNEQERISSKQREEVVICEEYTCRPFCPIDEETRRSVEMILKELRII